MASCLREEAVERWALSNCLQRLFTFKTSLRTCLEVQRLRLCASAARGTGSIPGQGTEIPQTLPCSSKTRKTKTFIFWSWPGKHKTWSSVCRHYFYSPTCRSSRAWGGRKHCGVSPLNLPSCNEVFVPVPCA